MPNALVVGNVDKEDCDFDGMRTVAKVNRNGSRGKFAAMETKGRTVLTEVPVGSVDVVRMPKSSIQLEAQLAKSDREFQKTQRELQDASCAVLEAEYFALSKSEEDQYCH